MSVSSPEKRPGEPAWRVALFFPEQGGWTETDYWALDDGPLVEFDNGYSADTTAVSVRLPGFDIKVAKIFTAAAGPK